MVSTIICIIMWSLVAAELTFLIVAKAKHRKKFDELRIGHIYADMFVNKKQKNLYLRNSVRFYFQLIDKQRRKGRYFVKYRMYDKYTNTCSKDELTMEYHPTDVYALISQTDNVSIWQKYDNLTNDISNWLEDIEYYSERISGDLNDEFQDKIKEWKNQLENYKKVL